MSWEKNCKHANWAPRDNGLFFQEWIWPLEARWLSLRWNGATGCGVIDSPWWPRGPINLSFRRWSAVMKCIVSWASFVMAEIHTFLWHPKLRYYSCANIMRFFPTWVAYLESLNIQKRWWNDVFHEKDKCNLQLCQALLFCHVLSRKKKVRWSWTDLENWIFLYASFLAMMSLDEKRWLYHVVAMFWYILHHFAVSILINFPRSQGNWSSIATHLCGSRFSRALTSYASSFVTATAIETRRRSMGMWLVGLVDPTIIQPQNETLKLEIIIWNLKVYKLHGSLM